MIAAANALERLRAGNKRFVAETRTVGNVDMASLRRELASGQQPFAAILCCSDSRVPPEIVFDQGLGDLFIMRVAGNIATTELVGSIEFAADKLGVRLVVVLGHSDCGAVLATLDALKRAADLPSPNLGAIVQAIRPAVEPLLAAGSEANLVGNAVRANIDAAVAGIQQRSDLLARLVAAGEMQIVGAEYALESGVVQFFTD